MTAPRPPADETGPDPQTRTESEPEPADTADEELSDTERAAAEFGGE
jgi:hypothetical protein